MSSRVRLVSVVASVVVLAWTFGFAPGMLASATETENETDQAERIAKDLGAQTELPEPNPGDDPSFSLKAPLPLAKLLLYLGGLIVAATIVLLVAMGIQRLLDGRTQPPQVHTAGGLDSLPSWAHGAMGDPDELAAEGRYTEAIHALLLLALRRLMHESGGTYPDSLTSREVVGRLKLPGVRRGSILQLIHASEVAWFGGVEADGPRFADCRRLFDRALAPETGLA